MSEWLSVCLSVWYPYIHLPVNMKLLCSLLFFLSIYMGVMMSLAFFCWLSRFSYMTSLSLRRMRYWVPSRNSIHRIISEAGKEGERKRKWRRPKRGKERGKRQRERGVMFIIIMNLFFLWQVLLGRSRSFSWPGHQGDQGFSWEGWRAELLVMQSSGRTKALIFHSMSIDFTIFLLIMAS